MDRELAQLKTLMETECNRLTHLNDLLLEEREALATRNVERLETITPEKITAIEAVEQSGMARQQWTQAHGLDQENPSLTSYLATPEVMATAPELDQLWQQVRSGLRSVHRENIVNGRIIARSRQSLSQLLSIVRGSVDTPHLYDRAGDTHDSGKGGEIARA